MPRRVAPPVALLEAFFEAIEVNAVDAWTLFDSLDADGDHLVSYEVRQILKQRAFKNATWEREWKLHMLYIYMYVYHMHIYIYTYMYMICMYI